MDLSAIFCTFGMCSILYAISSYLNVYCKHLEDENQAELLQKILALVSVILLILSIPAAIVFWPLRTLSLKRMEKYYRKDEWENAKEYFKGDIKIAVREERERMKRYQEMAIADEHQRSKETAIKLMTEKCDQCPYKKTVNQGAPGD